MQLIDLCKCGFYENKNVWRRRTRKGLRCTLAKDISMNFIREIFHSVSKLVHNCFY